jgi:hypothetical protein
MFGRDQLEPAADPDPDALADVLRADPTDTNTCAHGNLIAHAGSDRDNDRDRLTDPGRCSVDRDRDRDDDARAAR